MGQSNSEQIQTCDEQRIFTKTNIVHNKTIFLLVKHKNNVYKIENL